MNKTLSVKLLAISATFLMTSVYAAWIEYGKDENMTQYYESAIKKQGNIATVTVMSNATKPVEFKEGKFFRSVVIVAEFDCAKTIGRDLAYTFKSGAMGAGNNMPVGEVADRKWDA